MWQAKSFTVCLLICLFCLFEVSAQQEFSGSNPTHQRGKLNAKYQLEVFVDFQCPTCAAYNKKLDALRKKYPNDILITFRNFPLSIPAHDKALLAAKIAEAAGKQNKFWEMYDLLLRDQQKWTANKLAEQIFASYARKLRLNIKEFTADLKSKDVAERISLDLERAKFLKLYSTPSVLLNGKILDFTDALNLEEIISKDK